MCQNSGFTLIELLVVVLIIGVLSVVALPMYTRAVEKSRAAKMISSVRALNDAQQIYYMANGKYANSFAELDMDFGAPLAVGSSNMQACARGASFGAASSDAMRDGGDYEIAISTVYGVTYSVAYHKKRCSGVFMGLEHSNTEATDILVPDISAVYCGTSEEGYWLRQDWCSGALGTSFQKHKVPLAFSFPVVKLPL